MALAQLLGSFPLATFMERHYLRLPFALPGGCRHLLPLGGWQALDRILACPGVDLVAGREGTPWDGSPPRSGDEARALLAAGWTLGVRHAERHDEGLAELAADFHRDFRAPVDIHLYA